MFIQGACRIASQMLPVALTCATSGHFEVPQMRMVKTRPRNPLDKSQEKSEVTTMTSNQQLRGPLH